MTELSQIYLSPNVMGAIVQIINCNFAIGGRYWFQFVFSAQLFAKEHESIPVYGQVVIDGHVSSAWVVIECFRVFDEIKFKINWL